MADPASMFDKLAQQRQKAKLLLHPYQRRKNPSGGSGRPRGSAQTRITFRWGPTV
jgi:hypothetical protein